mgnify:CR=1 FL=1
MRVYIVTFIERVALNTATFFRARYGVWFLGFVSFLESAFPIPLVTDPFLVAYILAVRTGLWRGVVITTMASVLGGIVAYLMAAGFYEVLERTVLTGGMASEFQQIIDRLQNGAFWITLAGAFTPVPYTVVGLAAGFVGANLFLFILASFIGRGLRYLIVGWVTYRFGDQALAIARQRILVVSLLGLLIGLVYVWLH